MKPRLFTIGSTLLLVTALTACGGGGGSDADSAAVDAGSADSGSSPDAGAANPDSTTAVSGRVADGYIRGARVCVDLNENQQCDEDEPSAITGEGGVYALDIPADATDKPIVADIPADAIDEDTGAAVGRALVFSAPAEHPEFVSPMTTLVVEEMRANPALDARDAEASLKAVLGVSNDDVSLFDDYVEHGGDESEAEHADEFRYLHETARVVASMMKDIDQRVEQQASSSGIDIAGDPDTQQAIRELVRNEVKNLLPAIAQEVGALIETDATEDENTEGGTSGTTREPFDPDALAAQLAPEQEIEGLGDRIEAIKSEIEARKGDMRSLLQAGMYWLDFHCDYSDDQGWCAPEYGRVSLNAAGTEIEESLYVYDPAAAGWLSLEDYPDEDAEGDQPWAWYLDNGEWVAMADRDGPSGAVTFTDDGDAILDTEYGPSTVTATVFSVANAPLLHHLDKLRELEEHGDDEDTHTDETVDADGIAMDEPQGSDDTDLAAELDGVLFPADAEIHYLNIEQPLPEVLLFNWPDMYGDGCVDAGGNCNVVHVSDETGMVLPLSGIEELLTRAATGVRFGGFDYDDEHHRGIALRLDVDADDPNGQSGTATWLLEPSWEHVQMVEPDEYDSTHDIEGLEGIEGIIDPELVDAIDGIDFYEPLKPTDPEILAGIEPELVLKNCEMAAQYANTYLPAIDEHMHATDADGSTNADGTVHDTHEASTVEHMPLVIMLIDPITQDLVLTAAGEPVVVDCDEYLSRTFSMDDADGNVHTDGSYVDHYDEIRATTRWSVVEIDGQRMVEVELPLFQRHRDEHRGARSVLLIEQDSYVRRGVRQQTSVLETATTFNESAFELLKEMMSRRLQSGQHGF